MIIIKRLVHKRNNVTKVRIEPRSCNQNRRKNDAFTLSATLPTRFFLSAGCFEKTMQLRLLAIYCVWDDALFVCLIILLDIWLQLDLILQIFLNVFGCSGFSHRNSALWRYQHNLHFIFHCSTVSPTRGTNQCNELLGPSIYWWFWSYFSFKPLRLDFDAGSNFIGQVINAFARENV